MNTLKRWLPMAVCCLPSLAIAAIIGIGFTVGGAAFGGFLNGPLGLAFVSLGMLACPLSMGLMMRRGSGRGMKSGQQAAPGNSPAMACCPPEEDPATVRLAELRTQREALEREVAELQTESPAT
jgi:hypothetical protein